MTAVLCGDLAGAQVINHDSIRGCLPKIFRFLYEEAPLKCFGSPEKFEQWIKVGGLNGLAKDSAMPDTLIPTWQKCAARGMTQREAAEARGVSISAACRAAKRFDLKFRADPNRGKGRLGKPHTSETKAKIGAVLRGKPKSPEAKAKISAAHLAQIGIIAEPEIATYRALRRAGYTRAEALKAMGKAP